MDPEMSETSAKLPPLSIPRKAVLEGTIRYEGPVVLEGTVLGEVHCTNVLITERGAVDGTICAHTATIMGEASGAIYAEQVTLKTACSVTADIFHKNLSLENGCFFEGKSRRVVNPLTLAELADQNRYTSEVLVR
jgi:cytoskeletal protein CcmA (bactofilin family)